LNHVAKTFLAIGEWAPPAIIGICELENRYVLNKLIYETPLKRYKYKFIHFESPDLRGIDVALLYRPEVFRVVSSKNIRIRFPFDTTLHTRDILYIKGILFAFDTVSIFVNHWPSRRGGLAESTPRRAVAAKTLRSFLDSLQHTDPSGNIIIMGDFNDEPDQPSIYDVLRAREFSSGTAPESLVNLMLPKMRSRSGGTHKYQGKWAILDQFMVSGNLLMRPEGLKTSLTSARIFEGGFLSEDDERFLGTKPFRTYTGPRYTGGFSDHLPIYLDVWEGGR